MNKSYFSLSTCLALVFFFTCKKDVVTIVESIIETDTLYIVQQDTLYLTNTDTISLTTFIQDSATTFIVVRHAETAGIGNNPNLSNAGLARAEKLRQALSTVPLKAVYTTNFNRTTQTAQPTADDNALGLTIYNASNQSPFVDNVLEMYRLNAVLVVGHSNTVPELLNILVGSASYMMLPETEYDNLFVVTVFEKGNSKVVHLKYGE